MINRFSFLILPILVFALFEGCYDKAGLLAEENEHGSGSSAAAPNPNPPRREKIWEEFNPKQSLIEAQTIAGFGPRPAGEAANAKTRQYLIDQLTKLGWQPTLQRFSDTSPQGKTIEFCSLIARFSSSSSSSKRIIVGAHFDTPATQTYKATGASDGAAGTAILLELARVLGLDPQLAGKVELLLLDGSAPFHQLNANDGLFGSRFYAQILTLEKHADDILASVILQNVGSPVSLNFPTNSDPKLAQEFKSNAEAIGLAVEVSNRPFLTDHVPFAQAGIPSIALLEANAPQLNTADDTAANLTSESLARTGRLLLHFLATQNL